MFTPSLMTEPEEKMVREFVAEFRTIHPANATSSMVADWVATRMPRASAQRVATVTDEMWPIVSYHQRNEFPV